MKARFLDRALPSYQSFSNDQNLPENLTTSKFRALRHLSRSKNIVTQKADRHNTIVILDKVSHISATEDILNDHTKFLTLRFPLVKKSSILQTLRKESPLISSNSKMKKLLIKLLTRILNQLVQDQVYSTGQKKSTRRQRMEQNLSIQFYQVLGHLPTYQQNF